MPSSFLITTIGLFIRDALLWRYSRNIAGWRGGRSAAACSTVAHSRPARGCSQCVQSSIDECRAPENIALRARETAGLSPRLCKHLMDEADSLRNTFLVRPPTATRLDGIAQTGPRIWVIKKREDINGLDR